MRSIVLVLNVSLVIYIRMQVSVLYNFISINVASFLDQTVNQLLTEMDGFEANDGVVVIGATNRRNDLDRYSLISCLFDIFLFQGTVTSRSI